MHEHMFVTLFDQSTCDDTTGPWSDVHVATVVPAGWPEGQILAGLGALERIRREADAATAVLVAGLPDDRDATTRITRATGISAHQARQQRYVAAVIATLPAAQALLASGVLSSEHIAAIRPVMNLDGADALAFTAVGTTPEAFRRDVEQFRLAHEHGDDTTARQRVLRRLRFFAGPEGTIGFTGLLPPHEGASLKAMLDAIVNAHWKAEHPDRARTLDGHDGPTREQRLADALLELTGIGSTDIATDGTADEPEAPTQPPTRVTTSKPATIVVFDIDKYEAEMLNHGPVPVTASLFEDVRRSLYLYFKTAKGEILKFGRARRDPTIAQRLAVMIRDQHCQFGNCETPASMCDVHHLNEWLHDNGFTDVEVLALFCHPHHRHIHLNNLKATREADGTVTITDRTTGAVVARASPKRIAA